MLVRCLHWSATHRLRGWITSEVLPIFLSTLTLDQGNISSIYDCNIPGAFNWMGASDVSPVRNSRCFDCARVLLRQFNSLSFTTQSNVLTRYYSLRGQWACRCSIFYAQFPVSTGMRPVRPKLPAISASSYELSLSIHPRGLQGAVYLILFNLR